VFRENPDFGFSHGRFASVLSAAENDER